MKKFVIYTVMVGEYGSIFQPLVIDDRFDYILFSNSCTNHDYGIWQVRPIPQPLENTDNKRLSRYPKTHPADLLKEYEASLYMDANIQIVDQWVYDRFIELYESGEDIAGVQLVETGSDCIYSHSYDMCVRQAEHDYNAIVQMHELRKRGFPEHFGLNENNLIWRRHNDKIKKLDEDWWWWIVNYSHRDQFSYMYCFWANNIKRQFFLPPGEDTFNSSHFNRHYHGNNPNVKKQKWVHFGIFEFLRHKCRTLTDKDYERHRKAWLQISKLPFPRLFLFLHGVISVLPWAPRYIFHFVTKKHLK